MRELEDILIVGGYGVVGRRIATDLAPDYPGCVIVAGRNLGRTTQLATDLGHGVRGRQLDVTDPESIEASLGGVGVVLSCIDQPEPHLLRAAMAYGLAYTDIAPHLMIRRPTAAMHGEAARTGARIVLGAGLAPGISSMLARLGADRVGPVERVVSNLLLSVGDLYGPASLSYFLEEITLPYTIVVNGRETPAHAFSEPDRVSFPPPVGPRMAYLFPFSDQVSFPTTLGAKTSFARLALDPPWLERLLSALVRLKITSAMRKHTGTRRPSERLIRRLRSKYRSLDWYSVLTEVQGAGGAVRASITGRGQADGAAAGAAALARSLLEGEVEQPGVWLAEQVVPPSPFFARLAAHGLVPYVRAGV